MSIEIITWEVIRIEGNSVAIKVDNEEILDRIKYGKLC